MQFKLNVGLFQTFADLHTFTDTTRAKK